MRRSENERILEENTSANFMGYNNAVIAASSLG